MLKPLARARTGILNQEQYTYKWITCETATVYLPQMDTDAHSPACGRNQKDFKPQISRITQIKEKKPNYFETAILTKQPFNYLERYFSCLESVVQMAGAKM